MEEQFCDEDDAYWYENDLQLAAELGKVLLERNKELEAQLRAAQTAGAEQRGEIQLLSKQLEVLRSVNESRMRVYEEVDRNLQETEKKNERLAAEAKADKDKIKTLTDHVESLELRHDELQTKLEQHKREEATRRRAEKRTWSVPNLTEAVGGEASGVAHSHEFMGFPPSGGGGGVWSPQRSTNHSVREIRELKDALKVARVQLSTAERRRDEAQQQISALESVNRDLSERIVDFERFHEERRKDGGASGVGKVKRDDDATADGLCGECGQRLRLLSLHQAADLIETDAPDPVGPRGQLMRLKNGGSAYGSRESLNMIGLETITPTLESCGEILAAAAREAAAEMDSLSQQWHTDDDDGNTPTKPRAATECRREVSLLGELEEQYRSLVKKYERLIDAKTKRAKEAFTQDNLDISTVATPLRPKGRPASLYFAPSASAGDPPPTSWRRSVSGLDLTSPADPTEAHFSVGPPEYKKLFREIFETLKRSYSCADGLDSMGSEGAV